MTEKKIVGHQWPVARPEENDPVEGKMVGVVGQESIVTNLAGMARGKTQSVGGHRLKAPGK